MFGNHGLCGLLEEGAHGKSPKCLDGNLGDFGEFCKGLNSVISVHSCKGAQSKDRLKVFQTTFVNVSFLVRLILADLLKLYFLSHIDFI